MDGDWLRIAEFSLVQCGRMAPDARRRRPFVEQPGYQAVPKAARNSCSSHRFYENWKARYLYSSRFLDLFRRIKQNVMGRNAGRGDAFQGMFDEGYNARDPRVSILRGTTNLRTFERLLMLSIDQSCLSEKCRHRPRNCEGVPTFSGRVSTENLSMPAMRARQASVATQSTRTGRWAIHSPCHLSKRRASITPQTKPLFDKFGSSPLLAICYNLGTSGALNLIYFIHICAVNCFD